MLSKVARVSAASGSWTEGEPSVPPEGELISYRRSTRLVSPDNSGWTPGRYGGLGSDHTPGAWPLGDVQELAYRHAVGDAVGERLVTQRLVATAAWDGALPEARDPVNGDVVSRHWFAWPGAALAYVYLTRTPRE